MKPHNGKGTPPYSEAQVTAWLGWLARGMQVHGQTIFLIEQLQPSWLSTRTQRWVYLVTTRLIWAIVAALSFGLLYGLLGDLDDDLGDDLSEGLISGLLYGLLFALPFGLLSALIDGIRLSRKRSRSESNASSPHRRSIWTIVGIGLLGGLLGVLPGGPGPLFGLLLGVLFGLVLGFFWERRGLERGFRNEIQTQETIRVSRTYFPKGFRNGLLVGLLVGLVILLLIVGLTQELTSELPPAGLVLSIVVIFALLVGLISSIRPAVQELKAVPNQGILLSIRSASLLGGIGGLGIGLIVGLLGEETDGLAYGVVGGLCLFMWCGGLDVIQHGIVRFLLWRAGAMPWNYARFLDYAAEELMFLQKVGGGYMFVHRYLLEYFATVEQPGQPAATRQEKQLSAG